ncbi:MAG: bifunctional folylpolyglutamate synthase/dihydrofolate synthase, partial [Anaerofustis stercorihominis]|nr:bifunctional folylpolyglutamate synthase/dihydrofolate synthase [Anaerofustis stercorihominis]
YNEAVEYIHSTYKFGTKLELVNIKELLRRLGSPHEKLKFVHVAGSNGKGSTSTMISYVLKEAGYNTGLYISPYLERFNERMQMNNVPIADDLLVEIVMQVRDAVNAMVADGFNHPTEFEVVTATGMKFFEVSKADIVVLEVGMGGKFDATNSIPSAEAAVITTISFDHMMYLGDTLEAIAGEKAGIIKEGYDVSLYALNGDNIYDVVKAKADSVNATVHRCDPNDIEPVSESIDGQVVRYKKADSVLGVCELELALLGVHQMYNALNVLNTLEILKKRGWNITPEAVKNGLKNVRFTGRFEMLCKEPVIFIDGGHNIEGITAFTNNVKKYFPGKKINLFYGMLKDKQIGESLDLLTSISKRVYTLTPDEADRAVTAEEMKAFIDEHYPDVQAVALSDFDKVRECIDFDAKDEIYAFTGSLYMIGEARTLLNKLIEEQK